MLSLVGTLELLAITAETLHQGNTADNMMSDLVTTVPLNSNPPAVVQHILGIQGLVRSVGDRKDLAARAAREIDVTLPKAASGVLGVGIINGSWGTVLASFVTTASICRGWRRAMP